MNDLTPRNPNGAVALSFGALARAHAPMAAMVRRYLKTDALGTHRFDFHQGIGLTGCLRMTRHNYARAKTWLPAIPPRATLQADHATLHRALTEPADEAIATAIITAMLAAMPTAARIEPDYVEAVAFVLTDPETDEENFEAEFFHLRGYSAIVIFAAAKIVLRNSTFQPSIAEFIAAARKARRAVFDALNLAGNLIELREQAEELVADWEAEPEPNEPNVDPDAIPF